MYAILLTHDGLGGRFMSSKNGDPLVAVTEDERRYLARIAEWDNGQLVDLGASWPFSVTTVAQERRGDPFYPPPAVLTYEQAA